MTNAYKNKNDPYKEAENYLINRDYSNSLVECMIHCVIPVYRGETVDTTDGCTLYYSPKAQAALAKKYPSPCFYICYAIFTCSQP